MAKKRINGEGNVWYVASEKHYRAQYPAGGKRRTTIGKTRSEIELKLGDALAKRDTNTLEKSRKDSDTVEDFLLFWISAKTCGWQFKSILFQSKTSSPFGFTNTQVHLNNKMNHTFCSLRF